MKSSFLGTLLIVVSFTALTNAVRADQTVIGSMTVGGSSPVQTAGASCEALAIYVQALEILLLLVLAVAVVAIVFLIRLYRKTRF
jgi:predicted ATP-dependent Lon-type protease